MASAKDLVVKPISASDARRLVKRIHYSGKVVNNSSLHFGVFWNGKCEGAMQFGSCINKKGTMNLVKDTGWNEFIELNRMAFSEKLPRNSESRALSIAFRLIKKHYPHIKWIISFADGTQCGDGAIYRASGFSLVKIKKNTSMWQNNKTGAKMQDMQFYHTMTKKGDDWEKIPGFMLTYLYFIDKSYKERLTVPILPFSKIDEMGASMYKGKRIKRGLTEEQQVPPVDGGASPTSTLQTKVA